MSVREPQSRDKSATPDFVEGRGILSRTISRALIVLGVLALVASWRLDQAVGTAYRTDWVAPRFVAEQERALFGCSNCWRLPSEAWLWTYAFTGPIALFLLLIAAILFAERHRYTGTPKGLRQLIYVVSAIVAVVAVAEMVIRQFAARGYGRGFIVADTALDALALALLGVIVVAAAAGSRATEEGPYTLVIRVLRFLQRQRINVIGLLLLTAALLFIGQTSGQAIDSIRTWGFDSAHSIARLGFGIGATLLLSLVVYESAVRLTQVDAERDTWWEPAWWHYVAAGAALILLGVVLVIWAPFGYGPIVVGALLVLLGLLEIPDLEPKTSPSSERRAAQARYDPRISEVLAVVPLLVVASTGVAAAIDAALSRGKVNGLSPLVPTAILAVAAVLMTGERIPGQFLRPALRASVVIVGVSLVATILVVWALPTSVSAAVLACVGCAIAFLYTWWLFRIQPPPKDTEGACCSPSSLPAAVAVGVGIAIAVHWDTFGSTNTLGTVALISFALAFWLAILNYLIYLSFSLRPPKALRYIGLRQLPVVTLIAVAWIGAGAVRTPQTLHEARLTQRLPIATASAEKVIPGAPTLTETFNAWVLSQPELRGETISKSTAPVPMFLVAAHGGGIRAAYWTALALDCIVGGSSAGFDRSQLPSSPPTYQSTCLLPRRSAAQQQRAARRLFLASGVSGGALGLYAYARQLISEESLRDGSWVDDRLGKDFASATIGWGLFHDVTNHWFGLNSHRGGDCSWKIKSLCMTADRAAIQEEAFDRVWPAGGFPPLLRLTWDLRSSEDKQLSALARTVPLLITNSTVTGGKARGVVTAANLGTWPNLEAYDPGRGNFDTHPLAGTVEVVEAACATKDLRLSTAALLGARFPYVSPSGHLSGQCRRSKGGTLEADRNSPCASVSVSICEMRLVDGGYADNSGLFTVDALWSSLRQLIVKFNRTSPQKIAPVIVELDNHYQASLDKALAAGGTGAETIVPLATAFGARTSIETFARALAYRLRPPGCTVTISPGLHPGLTAPLGWELSGGARGDLQEGIVRPHPTEEGTSRFRPVEELRRLQQWLGTGNEASPGLAPDLTTCVPTETVPKG